MCLIIGSVSATGAGLEKNYKYIFMNAKQRLSLWLATKNKDYKTALDIFIDLNIDVKKVAFFSAGTDKVRRNILFNQLFNFARIYKISPAKEEKLAPVHVPRTRLKAQQMPKASPEGQALKFERPVIDTNPSVRFEDLPPNLQILFKENSTLFSEIKTLHTELKAIQDDPAKEERRKDIAKEIVERKNRSRSNWDMIDEWWNTRNYIQAAAPEPPQKTPEEIAVEEALKKEKRIRANLNYIRRYKNTEKEKQQKEVELRKSELDEWGVSYEEILK